MTSEGFQHEDDLARVVLDIIAYYQPIPTVNIWYELGEVDRFEGGIALAEVNEILSHLENERKIFKEDGDKWMLEKNGCQQTGFIMSQCEEKPSLKNREIGPTSPKRKSKVKHQKWE